MNLADHTLRVAALEALVAFFTTEYKAARREAETAYRDNKVKKVTIETPDGVQLGDITVKQPSASVVIDEDKLLAWVAEHTPHEVEEYLDTAVQLDEEAIEWARVNRDDLLRRRIRSVWRAELVKQLTAHGGEVIDERTGAATKVADVVPVRATGEFSLPPKGGSERRSKLMAALLRGDLKAIPVTALSIVAPAEGGEGA
ncbi:hypothetical protein ACGFNU_21660 [Spirillospora sp. NPDC048911]|uniref:hypothetical protein n=1 Tax=Spirillospora sp. NPDC048911 TaxID=3364527 RepID=UPI00371CEEC8